MSKDREQATKELKEQSINFRRATSNEDTPSRDASIEGKKQRRILNSFNGFESQTVHRTRTQIKIKRQAPTASRAEFSRISSYNKESRSESTARSTLHSSNDTNSHNTRVKYEEFKTAETLRTTVVPTVITIHQPSEASTVSSAQKGQSGLRDAGSFLKRFRLRMAPQDGNKGNDHIKSRQEAQLKHQKEPAASKNSTSTPALLKRSSLHQKLTSKSDIKTTKKCAQRKQLGISNRADNQDDYQGPIGQPHSEKQESQFRFAFLNSNGLPQSKIGMLDFIQSTREFNIDCMGVSETHLDSSKVHVRNNFVEAAKSYSGYQNVNCSFAQSDVDFGTERKRGGVLQMSIHNLANRVTATFSDKYGRFVSQTFIGRNSKTLMVISAYRVVEGTAGPSSAYAQQRAMLVTEGRPADPRGVFLSDMETYILESQQKGNSIILGVDANEPIGKPKSGIRKLMEKCGLVNAHNNLFTQTPWASHRQGSTQIDFLLVSPDVQACITRVGVGSFDEVFDSDHRPIFLDLDAVKFFRGLPLDPTDARSRSFTTKNNKHTQIVRTEITQEWNCRRLSDRIALLAEKSKQDPSLVCKEKITALWEKLDNEIGRVFQSAEKALKTPRKSAHKWSPALAKAGAVKRYWRVRLAWAQSGKHDLPNFSRRAFELRLTDDGSTDVAVLQQRYDAATKHFASITSRDVQMREDHLQQLQLQMAQNPNPEIKAEIQSIRSLLRTEQAIKTFRKIRNTLRPIRSGTLSKVEIPWELGEELAKSSTDQTSAQSPSPEAATILQRIIRHKRQATEEWVTVIDKPTLERSILLFCQQHFQQAAQTPFGSGHLAKLLLSSGLTPAGEQMLQGTWTADAGIAMTPELQAFISRLAVPAELRDVPQITSEVTVDEYKEAIRRWNERTSTSPSGRHLGFYKALLAIPQILSDMCEMFNVVTRCGLVPKRWCKAVSVLLEKDPGRPSINRLRIIHLFEADYNLFLKIFWARRLVHRGEEYKQFGESQQGSRKGRRANDAVLLKRLTYDLTRIQRSNLGTFDNDAKSCYDRIINSVAMMAARRLGMPENQVATHAGVLKNMRYVVKTAYGVSESYIQSTSSVFLFGTGQGSGASPAIWLTLSTLMLDTLKELLPRGMKYISPDQSMSVERYSDAFVDDTQNGLSDSHLRNPWSLEQTTTKLQHMAQTWEKILSASGGALEASKCSYYILQWKWIKGLPHLIPKAEFPPRCSIELTSGTTTQAVMQRDFNEPHKTLGVWMTPNGDDWAQVEFLRREANKVATLIASSHLTKSEAMLAYHTHWIPSVGYSLGTMTMEPRDLRSIQSQATASFLQKLGFNKHFPRAAVFGPAEMGGLALRDLVVEQGIAQIMTLMDHLYNKTETGKLIRISLATLQMEAGTQGHLLYETIPQLTYISSCWISAIRNFIRTNQIQLEISSLWNFPLQRGGDMFIMDTFRQSGQFSGKDLINLNAVRLYLQVGTLADITSADGQSIDEYAHRAHKCPYRLSSLTWIRQPEISLHQASYGLEHSIRILQQMAALPASGSLLEGGKDKVIKRGDTTTIITCIGWKLRYRSHKQGAII